MDEDSLGLESTIQGLPLYYFQIESSHPAKSVAPIFEANPLLPGVILTGKQGEFVGMVSRRLFFEKMGGRYGLEMFSKRPIEILYRFSQNVPLIISCDTLIVQAAQQVLQRESELLYEPIIVELGVQNYRILDVHNLLVAHSKIHELTCRLLKKQTQAKNMQTEKLVSLGKMMAGIAHEIRNPVNCIWNNLIFTTTQVEQMMQLILAYEESPPQGNISPNVATVKSQIDLDELQIELPETIDAIKVATEQLINIINSLRNFSYMDESKKRPADLHECLDSTILILNSRLKNRIEVIKNYGKVPIINCYSGQLSQVFMNLLSNAIDALYEKITWREKDETVNADEWIPTLKITTELIKLHGVDWVSVKIMDNGVGIPSDVQNYIFENFFTTKEVGKGTGIGLTICHQIITEKHNGKLSFKSIPGQQTEFDVQLPVV